MSTKQIATSTLWQIASQMTMALLSAVSVKFVAIGLSQELAGQYNSAYSYLQLFAILADFGLYAVSVREASAAKDKAHVLGGLITLRFIIAAISLGAAVIIAWLVPSWRGTPLPTGVAIASLVPFFTLLAGTLRTTFQITFRMHYVFIAEVLQRVLTTGLMALLIFMGARLSTDVFMYELFLWVGSAGALFLFLLSIIFSMRILPVRPVFDAELLRCLMRKAAPYGVAFLCIALYRQFDLTMIALLRSDFSLQNAFYGFASRVAEMTYLVPTFLLNSTLPILSERSAKGERTDVLLGKTLLIILAFGGATALFSFFWATPIMRLLTTYTYLASPGQPGSDTALSLLAAPMFLNGIVLFSFYTLLTKHEWRPLVITMMIGVVISVSLNFLWIPQSGFTGAIQTSTVVHLFLAVILLPLTARVMPIRFPAEYAIRLGVFLGVLALLLSWTRMIPQTTTLALGGLVIGGLATVLLAYLCGFHRVFTVGAKQTELQPPAIQE